MLVLETISFNDLEKFPDHDVIEELIHLKILDVKSNLIDKGGFQRLTYKFLIGKASTLASKGSMVAFETIIVLLIYGMVIFPNINNFIDFNALQIFMVGNHVPNLLGDTLYSIHYKTLKESGCINSAYDTGVIIDGCGEFSNVPLLKI